jgi:hypothetical protein
MIAIFINERNLTPEFKGLPCFKELVARKAYFQFASLDLLSRGILLEAKGHFGRMAWDEYFQSCLCTNVNNWNSIQKENCKTSETHKNVH